MDINWTKVDNVAGGLTKSELFNEALFALGGKYCYNGVNLPQPTAGSFMLLEIIKSPYLAGGDITEDDIDNAVFILLAGKDAVSAIFEDRLFDNPIDQRVMDFIDSFDGYNRMVFKVFLNTYFKYGMNGFNMIPSSEDGPTKKMVFDTDWLTGYVSTCQKITGYDWDKVVWEMPLILGGFCIARSAKDAGAKGIERPEDWKAQLEELRNQIEDGK